MLRVRSKIDLTPLFKSGFLVTFGAEMRHNKSKFMSNSGPKLSLNGYRETETETETETEPETETETETETEKTPTPPKGAVVVVTKFDEFWKAYPRKTGKGAALKSWKKINPSDSTAQQIIDSLPAHIASEQWQKDNGQFIPHPATWLNQGRWEDEPIHAKTPHEKLKSHLQPVSDWHPPQPEKVNQ